jgi:hypothetical protein
MNEQRFIDGGRTLPLFRLAPEGPPQPGICSECEGLTEHPDELLCKTCEQLDYLTG